MDGLTLTSRQEEIRTARLLLRRVRPEDVMPVHAIMSDPESMQFWSTAAHANLAETEAWFASMVAADSAEQSDEFILEHGGAVIGKMGVWRQPEIGFFLHRGFWGRGFATEALAAYIGYVKGRGFTNLTADVDPRNARCIRVLEKCGFTETGRKMATYVVDGRACDSVYLHLDLQTHWKRGSAR